MEHHLPSDIERTSMAIITRELQERGISLQPGTEAIVKRVIHATADFDFAKNLVFTGDPQAVITHEIVERRSPLVTDTHMALSGISKRALKKLGCDATCYMTDPEVMDRAKKEGTTRAVASMKKAARENPHAIIAVGNAPTALFTLSDLIEKGLRPAMVIGVPVGFVNVVEAKERILKTCQDYGVPGVFAMGRKGGSTVAAAICNALLYSAADMLDPVNRGWN